MRISIETHASELKHLGYLHICALPPPYSSLIKICINHPPALQAHLRKRTLAAYFTPSTPLCFSVFASESPPLPPQSKAYLHQRDPCGVGVEQQDDARVLGALEAVSHIAQRLRQGASCVQAHIQHDIAPVHEGA